MSLAKLMSFDELTTLQAPYKEGRVLSINVGKQVCVGVIHLNEGFAKFNYSKTSYESQGIGRGDLISFSYRIQNLDSKGLLIITTILSCTPCKGPLPNKQFNDSCSGNRIVSSIFDPEVFELLKFKSFAIRQLRLWLYDHNYIEVSTPTLFESRSPSSAPCFSVETKNGSNLYLKSIHEHLLKPYLLVGFEKVFEIGPVFRNIGYSNQYDCEFTNLDIWSKSITFNDVINLCVEIVQTISKVANRQPYPLIVTTVDEYAQRINVESSDVKEIKKHALVDSWNTLLILTLFPHDQDERLLTDSRFRDRNLEMHAYLNGVSFAHGYIIDCSKIQVDSSSPNDCCTLFEEFAVKYGLNSLGGLGVGLEKLLQGILSMVDYDSFSLYRRKY